VGLSRRGVKINTPAFEPGVRGVEAWSGILLLLMFKPALCLLGLADKFLCFACSDWEQYCNRYANSGTTTQVINNIGFSNSSWEVCQTVTAAVLSENDRFGGRG
jgi:hypothetical protein